MENLSEFLVIHGRNEEGEEQVPFIWNRGSTLMLLDLYKKLRGQVGSLKIKNLKKLFELIAREMSTTLKQKVMPYNCENRWKVLERGYKKFIDNSKQTGRGRRDFEYSESMSEILGDKRNINPETVLSSETVQHLEHQEVASTIIEAEIPPERQANITKQSRPTKFDLMRKIRNERRGFYEKYLEIKSKSIEARNKRNEIEEKKLKEKTRKNDLIEETVQVLKEATSVLKKLVEDF